MSSGTQSQGFHSFIPKLLSGFVTGSGAILSSRKWWKKSRGGNESGAEEVKESQIEESTGEEASVTASAGREAENREKGRKEAVASADEEQEKQTWESPGEVPAESDTKEGATVGAELNPLEEEVVLEEVILDDEPAPADGFSSEQKAEEEGHGEAGALNSAIEGEDEGAEDENSRKQHARVLLQRKKTFVWAGTLLFVTGVALFFFFEGYRTRSSGHEHFFSRADGKGNSSSKTVLKPFFIPLTGNSEHAALCLIVSVRWDSQTLARYREKKVRVRNEIYQFLLHAADSGEDLVKEKSVLESKLSTVFQHALAARNIAVNVDEASTI